jgi:hypothetical protein
VFFKTKAKKKIRFIMMKETANFSSFFISPGAAFAQARKSFRFALHLAGCSNFLGFFAPLYRGAKQQ